MNESCHTHASRATPAWERAGLMMKRVRQGMWYVSASVRNVSLAFTRTSHDGTCTAGHVHVHESCVTYVYVDYMYTRFAGVCVCVCVRVCVCAWVCACVCACARERKREQQREQDIRMCVTTKYRVLRSTATNMTPLTTQKVSSCNKNAFSCNTQAISSLYSTWLHLPQFIFSCMHIKDAAQRCNKHACVGERGRHVCLFLLYLNSILLFTIHETSIHAHQGRCNKLPFHDFFCCHSTTDPHPHPLCNIHHIRKHICMLLYAPRKNTHLFQAANFFSIYSAIPYTSEHIF